MSSRKCKTPSPDKSPVQTKIDKKNLLSCHRKLVHWKQDEERLKRKITGDSERCVSKTIKINNQKVFLDEMKFNLLLVKVCTI